MVRLKDIVNPEWLFYGKIGGKLALQVRHAGFSAAYIRAFKHGGVQLHAKAGTGWRANEAVFNGRQFCDKILIPAIIKGPDHFLDKGIGGVQSHMGRCRQGHRAGAVVAGKGQGVGIAI